MPIKFLSLICKESLNDDYCEIWGKNELSRNKNKKKKQDMRKMS